MKRLEGFAAGVLATAGLLAAPAVGEPLRVAFTFDDALVDHVRIAAPALEKRGWRGTFCLVTDWVGWPSPDGVSWENARELVRRGHELVTHTKSHANLLALVQAGKGDAARRELALSRDAIAEHTGFTPRFFCPPYVAQNEMTEWLGRKEGLRQMLPCRRNFGAGDEGRTRAIVEEAIRSGATRLDLLHHGIQPATGGYKPFASVADFERHLDAIAALEKEGKVIVTDYDGMVSNCRLKAKPWPRHGVVALSFDDRQLYDWTLALPLFQKFDARATFFVRGAIDLEALAMMRCALEAGCEPGLHGLKHRDADRAVPEMGAERFWREEILPQLAVCQSNGIPIRSYAYPDCARTAESDAVFFAHGFTRLRGTPDGVKGPNPYSPAKKTESWHPVATYDPVFAPAVDFLSKKGIGNVIMGDAYHTDIDDILAAMRRAGERGELLSLVSHGIWPNTTGINMKTAWLEAMLSSAAEAGVLVRGVR